MKKFIFFAAVMIGIAGFANAQNTVNYESDSAKQKPGSKSNPINTNSASNTKPGRNNNRVEIKSKRTKQLATPTGQQATGTNGAHANNPKNAGKTDE